MTEPTYNIKIETEVLRLDEKIGHVLGELILEITGNLNGLKESKKVNLIIDEENDLVAQVDYLTINKELFIQSAVTTYTEVDEAKKLIKQLLFQRSGIINNE